MLKKSDRWTFPALGGPACERIWLTFATHGNARSFARNCIVWFPRGRARIVEPREGHKYSRTINSRHFQWVERIRPHQWDGSRAALLELLRRESQVDYRLAGSRSTRIKMTTA